MERVSVGVEKPLRLVSYDDVEDEDDDLFLSDVDFVKEWLPEVCRDLKSVSISDFWVQSCWRRTDVLSLISSYCELLFSFLAILLCLRACFIAVATRVVFLF